ncbi:hypothetical protein G7Y79_00067g095610 [Physcia stellaris]|nr:hypothetical protein G7Y79_00067g095610 [Physcia stellaris]
MVEYVPDGYMTLTSVEAFCWSMTALAIVFSILRYWIRLFTPKKYMWDDLTHLLALGTSIATVALYQTLFRDGLQRKLIPPPSQEVYVNLYVRVRHRSIAIALLTYTTLWLVKATFLLLYREIFWINKTFRKAWWAVTLFIIITYWATVGAVAGVLVRCGSVKNNFSIEECMKPTYKYNEVLLDCTCALGVATDVAVIVLPIWMLKGLQMHLRQKLGLGFMFSLAIIITVFDIVRTIKSEGQSSISEVAVYNMAQSSVAIIVSSVSVYRSFLSSHRQSKKNSYYLTLKGPSLGQGESRGAHQSGGSNRGITPKSSARDISRSRDTDLDVEPHMPEDVHV